MMSREDGTATTGMMMSLMTDGDRGDHIPVTGRPALIFVLPYKIQRKRLEDMKSSMLKKNIAFANTLDQMVTHVVTEFETLQQVNKQVSKDRLTLPEGAQVVCTKWLVECLKASKIMPVLGSDMLKEVETLSSETDRNQRFPDNVPEWACQRGARLEHFNQKLVDALEILQLHAELRDANQDYSRALAFRRASCVLKSLPLTLTYPGQLAGIKDIGGHVLRVITDILDSGCSSEVDEIVNSQWFNQMKTFTNIFGVGPSTAKNWIARGWTTVEDVRQAGCPSSDWRMIWGLAFYEDLTNPVSLQEAHTLTSIVRSEAEKILPGTMVTLTGGFRRGKQSGHDVDLLITHPKEGEEVGILPRLLSVLARKGLVLVGHREENSYRPDIYFQDPRTSMRGQLDHFEKWLGICKFHKSFQEPCVSQSETDQPAFVMGESKKQHVCSVHGDVPKSETGATECCEALKMFTQASCSDEDFESSRTEGCINIDDSFDEMFEPHVKKSKLSDKSKRQPTVLARSQRDWLARRVDLIVTPYSQYYFALFGWTGSKHFNRDARLFAQRILGLKLTSHGLFDIKQQKHLSASSEEDVFTHLQLPYREPTYRNC